MLPVHITEDYIDTTALVGRFTFDGKKAIVIEAFPWDYCHVYIIGVPIPFKDMAHDTLGLDGNARVINGFIPVERSLEKVLDRMGRYKIEIIEVDSRKDATPIELQQAA